MAEKELAVCDECGSLFFKGSSQMMGLYPECAQMCIRDRRTTATIAL